MVSLFTNKDHTMRFQLLNVDNRVNYVVHIVEFLTKPAFSGEVFLEERMAMQHNRRRDCKLRTFCFTSKSAAERFVYNLAEKRVRYHRNQGENINLMEIPCPHFRMVVQRFV